MKRFLAISLTAILLGCSSEDPEKHAQAARIKELDAKVAALDEKITALRKEYDDTSKVVFEVATKADSFNIIEIDNAFDTYADVGYFWQVTNLALASHVQGCMVKGKILNRLYVNRNNVDMRISLLDKEGKMISAGRGVIKSARPGTYSPFSVLVKTDKHMSVVNAVSISIDNQTGTTSEL